MNFKPYESKPVTRMAFQITASMGLEKHDSKESTYTVFEGPEHDMNVVHFKAYEEPKVGDWVVRLTEDDTYHCTEAVFRERNIVSDTLNEFGKTE